MPENIAAKPELKTSKMAETLIGSEIIKLAADINQQIQQGEKIFNYTIGDFDPAIFPIPGLLEEKIIAAYKNRHTNYPAANGILPLRQSIANFVQHYQQLNYQADEILVAGGARPLIYGVYQTLLDPGDKVVFPVPSWNNNHYSHLSHAQQIQVITSVENNFMPTAAELKPHLKGATLLALCSPLNPTGTTFTAKDLKEICNLVLEENASRSEHEKPLYLMYDQIYSMLCYGNSTHVDPVSLCEEMREYTIFIDGISKAFAATGVRVGWAMGPKKIMAKMQSILGHIGAWAPKPEQVATAEYLSNFNEIDSYLIDFKSAIHKRLQDFYIGIKALKAKAYKVDAIAPQAAIYLTVYINLKGKKTQAGQLLENDKMVGAYLLNEAKLAIVPFTAFGSDSNSSWYRLSVGTCAQNEVEEALAALAAALEKLV